MVCKFRWVRPFATVLLSAVSLGTGFALWIAFERAMAAFHDERLVAAAIATAVLGLPGSLIAAVLILRLKSHFVGRLDASEGRQRAILAAMGEGIIAFDHTGRCTWINPAALRLLGLEDDAPVAGVPVAELTGHTLLGQSCIGNCPLIAPALRGKPTRGDRSHAFRRNDGQTFPVAFRSEPLHEDGCLIGGVMSFRDMTAAHRAEQVLAAEATAQAAFADLAADLLKIKGLQDIPPLVIRTFNAVIPGAETAVALRLAPDEEFVVGGDDAMQAVARGTRHPEDGEALAEAATHDGTAVRVAIKGRAIKGRTIKGGAQQVDDIMPAAIDRAAAFIVLAVARIRATRDLLASEQRYRELVEDHADMLCRFLPDGTLIFVNDTYCRAFGLSTSELPGHPFLGFVPPEDHAVIKEALAGVTPNKPIVTSEHKVIIDGKTRWQQWVNQALFDANGRLLGYQAGGRDTTERRQAEAILRRREAVMSAVRAATEVFLRKPDWQTAMDQAFTGIGEALDCARIYVYRVEDWACDLDDTCDGTIVNLFEWRASTLVPLATTPFLARFTVSQMGIGPIMLRLSRGESVAQTADTLPPALAAYLVKHGARSLLSVPLMVRSTFWGFMGVEGAQEDRLWSDPTRDGLRAIANALSAAIHRGMIDQELRSREARLHALMEAVSDGLLELDSAGLIVAANAGTADLFGCAPGSLVGRPFAGFLPPGSALLQRIESILTGEPPWIGEAEVLNLSGERIPVDVGIGTWGHVDGPHFSLLIRDVRSRKEAERQLSRTQRADALGNLASGIAHDFNNMLLPILSLSEMVRSALPPDDRNRKRLDAVVDAATRAADLVRRILAFSREQAPEMAPLAVHGMLEDVVALMESVIPSSIRITTDVPPIGMVMGDQTQLQAVLLNIASNAADAIDGSPGNIWIKLTTIRASTKLAEHVPALDAGTRYALIRVSDDGHGMPDHVLNRIFDPFFTTKPVGAGTGLGLAAAQDIVSRHSGAIMVRSQPGKGTTFEVYLPLQTSAEAAIPVAEDVPA